MTLTLWVKSSCSPSSTTWNQVMSTAESATSPVWTTIVISGVSAENVNPGPSGRPSSSISAAGMMSTIEPYTSANDDAGCAVDGGDTEGVASAAVGADTDDAVAAVVDVCVSCAPPSHATTTNKKTSVPAPPRLITVG